MYQVKTQKFEGPLDLLLDLIDKKKLSINEFSLAQIADQYLDYLKEIETFPVREAAFFIVVAATLMLVKSRSLVPSFELSEEEETEIYNLEEQLRLYKRYRFLAKELEKIFGQRVIFAREAFLQTPVVFAESKDLSLVHLGKAMSDLLNNLSQFKKESLPQAVVIKTVTLEQKIDDIIKRMEGRIKMCFSDFRKNSECQKVDLIVSFLALLELTKRGLIIVRQEGIFGEIDITKHGI